MKEDFHWRSSFLYGSVKKVVVYLTLRLMKTILPNLE